MTLGEGRDAWDDAAGLRQAGDEDDTYDEDGDAAAEGSRLHNLVGNIRRCGITGRPLLRHVPNRRGTLESSAVSAKHLKGHPYRRAEEAEAGRPRPLDHHGRQGRASDRAIQAEHANGPSSSPKPCASAMQKPLRS